MTDFVCRRELYRTIQFLSCLKGGDADVCAEKRRTITRDEYTGFEGASHTRYGSSVGAFCASGSILTGSPVRIRTTAAD